VPGLSKMLAVSGGAEYMDGILCKECDDIVAMSKFLWCCNAQRPGCMSTQQRRATSATKLYVHP